MIDLTEDSDHLPGSRSPSVHSDSDIEIIMQIPARYPNLETIFPPISPGQQIRLSQDLRKKKYPPGGVMDRIKRYRQEQISGDVAVIVKRTGSRKERLMIREWYETPLLPGPRPTTIPVLRRDEQPNPVLNLYLDQWFLTTFPAASTDTVSLVSDENPQATKRTHALASPPPTKRPKKLTDAKTLEEFLETLRSENLKISSHPPRHEITLNLVSTVQSVPPPPPVLTEEQKEALERARRNHLKQSLTDFYEKVFALDLFTPSTVADIPPIPGEFASGKNYVETMKSACLCELEAEIRSWVPGNEDPTVIDLRLHRLVDEYMLLSPGNSTCFSFFHSNDILLCVHHDQPWRPSSTPPSSFYFLGIVETFKESSYTLPIVRAKANDQLKDILSGGKDVPFQAVTVMGAVTVMREIQAVQCAEFADLFQTIEKPKAQSTPQALNLPEGWMQGLSQAYNAPQIEAISEVCRLGKGITLIQGPPGTGKTHTIIGLISAILSSRERWGKKPALLVCAPSNNAVDEIALRVMTEGVYGEYGDRQEVKCVRVGKGKPEGCSQVRNATVTAIGLENLVSEKLGKEGKVNKGASISQLNSQLGKIRKDLQQAKINSQDSSSVLSLLKQQKAVSEKLSLERREKQQSSDKRKRLEDEILSSADIIFSTLAGAGSKSLDKYTNSIEFIIVDEACQCSEPTTLIPLQKKTRLMVLVGDPMQLPATVTSQVAVKAGYNRSLFERLMNAGRTSIMLTEQHRMEPCIRAFPSHEFYSERLTDAWEVKSRQKPSWLPEQAFLFLDVLDSQEESDGTSFYNYGEASYVGELVRLLYLRGARDLAVISPYKRQVLLLKERLKQYSSVEIDTVDGFQGREKDAVILSPVRSKESLGFVHDARRLNVALTRARFGLWIIGCAKTLSREQHWSSLIRHCEENACLVQCSGLRQVTQLLRSRQGD